MVHVGLDLRSYLEELASSLGDYLGQEHRGHVTQVIDALGRLVLSLPGRQHARRAALAQSVVVLATSARMSCMTDKPVSPSGPVGPVTVASLVADLRNLGVGSGSVVLVHASLSALGRVVGDAQAVVAALRIVLGPNGTLVMPTQSWQLCDPEYLNEPGVPSEWWPTVRDHLPAYDSDATATRTMGAIAELFRGLPGTVRSAHPHRSFAAAGPHASKIIAVHDLDSPNGERSPLRALYDLDAATLLLGVGHDKNTALHLAEHRSGIAMRLVPNGAPLLVDGERIWVDFLEPEVHDHDFGAAAAFARDTGLQRTGRVGAAAAHLVQQRALADDAAAWFTAHRGSGPGAASET